MARRMISWIRERGGLVLLAHVVASYVCLISAVLVFEPRKLGAYLLPVLGAPLSTPVALVVVTVAATTLGKVFCWTAYLVPFGAVLLVRRRLGTVGAYRAFTAAAVVVLVLVVGLVLSGVRSFGTATYAAVALDRVSFYVQSARGEVALLMGVSNASYGMGGGVDESPVQWADRARERQSRIVDKRFSLLGFALHTGDPSRRHANGVWVPVTLEAPYWFFVLVMLLLGWWILRQRGKWLRRERKARGLCETCGYDLRESRGRCSECGTDVVARFWISIATRVNRLWMGGAT